MMIDSTDHITGKTGLTVTVTLSKAGGAFGAAGGTVTEVSSGWYKIALTTTDTNTLAELAYHCTATGADATDFRDQVVSFDTQDAVRLGLTALPNVASGSAGAIPTTGSGANQISVSSGQVILQTGTGTGQLDFTSGVVKANLAQILGTALTETAGQIAAAFKQFFNIGSPTSTMNTITAVTTTTTATNLTNAATAGDLTATMKTSVTTAATAATPTAAAVTAAVSLSAKDSFTVRNATAQAGAASSITLDASASATDSFYNGAEVKLDSGTGVGQTRTITAYVGSTKVATVDRAWATNPASDSVFTVFASSQPKVDSSLAVTVGTNSDKTGYTASTVSDKTGYALTAAYDLAKTAAQTGDVMKLSSGTGANQISLSSGTVTVGTNNDKTGYTASTVSDKTGYSLTQSFPTNFSSLSIDGSGKVSLTNPTALKKNVALANFMFFMVDSADHITPKTGLTVSASRSLDGGAFASCANSVTELSNGWYIINLAATDTNANVIAFKFTATGADQTNILAVTNA